LTVDSNAATSENELFAERALGAGSLTTISDPAYDSRIGGMMLKTLVPGNSGTSLKIVLLVGILTSAVLAQSAPATPGAAPVASPTATAHRNGAFRPVGFDPRAKKFYQLIWGVDGLSVKSAESGEMIRFSYTVLDANKAAQLNDKKANPALIDEGAGVSLVIPSLEKVGQLRQTGTPEAGKSYWMVFSNKGRVVKAGDRVSVVIGKFRVDGLIVE
jgi:hypothetical protein